jgi:hypothetical protein
VRVTPTTDTRITTTASRADARLAVLGRWSGADHAAWRDPRCQPGSALRLTWAAPGRPGTPPNRSGTGLPAATRTLSGSSPSPASRPRRPRPRPSAQAGRSPTTAEISRSRRPEGSTPTTASSAAAYRPSAAGCAAPPSPESSAYRQRRELAEQAHQLAGQVGLRQAARQLGIHRDALKAAFAHWGLPALALRVGWQPSRFLTDRAEAERAFRLAERLGSVRHGEKRPRRLGRSFRRVIT